MLAHLPLLFHLSYCGSSFCSVLFHLVVIAIFPIHFERAVYMPYYSITCSSTLMWRSYLRIIPLFSRISTAFNELIDLKLNT